MEVSRRSFLGGALTLTAAAVLPFKTFAAVPVIHGDGYRDDSAGLQAAIDGKPFRCVGEQAVVRNQGQIFIGAGVYRLSRTLHIRESTTVYGGAFHADDNLTGPVLHMSGGTMVGCYVESGKHSTSAVDIDGPSTIRGIYSEGWRSNRERENNRG